MSSSHFPGALARPARPGGADLLPSGMRTKIVPCLLAAALLATAAVSAQTPPPPPPVSHDFDFWIGDWEVTAIKTRKLAGYNLIEQKHDGRVLVENYTTPSGFSGMSVNAYDPREKRWHQCWMDNRGGVLDLYGGLVDGSMVMTGETPLPGGAKQQERIT